MANDYPQTQSTGGVPSVSIAKLRDTRKTRAAYRRADAQLQRQEDRELLSLVAHRSIPWIAEHLEDPQGDAGRITRQQGKRHRISRTQVERRIGEARKRLSDTNPQLVAEVDAEVAARQKRGRARSGKRSAAVRQGLTLEQARRLAKRGSLE